MFFLNRKEKANEKKIEQLGKSREESRKRIRKIKNEMDILVQKAAASDDLDRKIYAADYTTLKDQFQAEMQHFGDLSRLIGQLKSAGLTHRRAAALEQIVSVNDRLDLDQLINREDYMAARRQMMQEEDEMYQEVLNETNAGYCAPKEDDEFTRLVTKAQIRNTLAAESEQAEPTEKTETIRTL